MSVEIERSALVRFSCQQMFKLVNDVASYPEFISGVQATEVIEDSDDYLVAALVLSKAGVKVRFVTRNKLVFPETMTLSLEEGPFRSMDGVWRFTPLGDLGCKVQLTLSFEPDNAVLGKAVSMLMSQVCGQLVNAFSERAERIYGG